MNQRATFNSPPITQLNLARRTLYHNHGGGTGAVLLRSYPPCWCREKVADNANYTFTIPAAGRLEVLQFDPDVTFLVGENGTGMSTLLEAISVALGFGSARATVISCGPRASSTFRAKSERLDGDVEHGRAIIEAYYILDEPEAALSPSRQPLVLRRMRELVLQESQFIIATHSPILMAYPNRQKSRGWTSTATRP